MRQLRTTHARSYMIMALICVAALLIGGCVPGATPSADAPTAESSQQPQPTAGNSASDVTITFGAASFMRHTYDPLIDAFNAQHPGMTVQFVSLDEVYQGSYDEQTRQIVSRADTAEAGVNEEEFNLGLLHDLKPLIDADPSFNRDDFYPSALDSATTASGAVYMLPQTLDVQLLFYNKDLWAARGLGAPKPE